MLKADCQVSLFVGKPDESKGSGPVWRRGKDGDHFKVLPIPITLTGLSQGSGSGTSSMPTLDEMPLNIKRLWSFCHSY